MVYCLVMHKALTDEMDRIEQRVASAGQTMNAFLRAARVSRSTWWRWRAGEMAPGMRAWNRVLAEYSRLPWSPCGGVQEPQRQKAAS